MKKEDPLFAVHGKPMSVKGMVNYFAELNDTCKFGFLGRQRYFRSHILRKFFTSTLQKHNVQQLNTDWMLGHTINQVTDAYFKPDIDSVRREYVRVLPYLCIEKVKTRTIESPEFKELKETHKAEMDELRREVAPILRAIKRDPEILERIEKNMGEEL